jgi:hypothetical protein
MEQSGTSQIIVFVILPENNIGTLFVITYCQLLVIGHGVWVDNWIY